MARQIPHVASYGIVKYNDFTFPPALNASAKAEPVYDESGRGLMYVRYQIRIEFIISLDDVGELGESGVEFGEYKPNVSSGNYPHSNAYGPQTGHPNMPKGTIDPQMAHLRRQLMQPARHLQIQDIGLGYDINVNQRTGSDPNWKDLYDVAWGPKPISMSWESIASNRAARVVWEVEVALPECEDVYSSTKENVPNIFNQPQAAGALPVEVTQVVYNITWDIDSSGKTVKRYQAVLQIRGYIDPNNLTEVLRSSDAYRQYFEPPVREGYIRTRSYSLSNDKSKLTINITDTQHGSDFPLPPGVPEIDVDYSISSGIRGRSTFKQGAGFTGWQIWQARLSGKMILAKGFNPAFRKLYPYYVFLLIIRSRFTLIMPETNTSDNAALQETYDQFGAGTYPPNITAGTKVMSLPVSLELGESVFGQEFTFNFQWEIIGVAARAAPFFLRYGCPPNVLMEKQYDTNPKQQWTWDLWMKSMYYDRDNNGWSINLYISVPAPPSSGSGTASTSTIRLHILGDWDIKRAPFSMSGADNLRFEGDARMEPCQPSPDFWYTPAQGSFSANTPITYSEMFAVPHNVHNTVIACESKVEINEKHQVIGIPPLDNYDDPTSCGANQDGNDMQKGTVNAIAGVPQGVGQGTKTPSNTIGDTNMISDPVTFEIEPGGLRDIKLQSMGPASYTIRCTGEALTTGLPFNAPRTMRWGKGYAVIQNKRVETARVCRGEVELWNTKWDITYLISGSPNGWVAPNPKGLRHYASQIGTQSATNNRWV